MIRVCAIAIACLLLAQVCAASAQEGRAQPGLSLARSGSPSGSDGGMRARCDALFEQAASKLLTEQYTHMLELAQRRTVLCPGPESALIMGLAEANLVDTGLVGDPPEREHMRQRALHHLRVAATHAALLPQTWHGTVGEWLVALQRRGPWGPGRAQAAALRAEGEMAAVSVADRTEVAPIEVPAAPSPQPQARFPWGPMITGTAGTGLLAAGLILAVSSHKLQTEAESALAELSDRAPTLRQGEIAGYAAEIRDINHSAVAQGQWATITLVGGGVALATAVAWYFLFPPEGKWRWAAGPSGIQTSVRF